MNKSKKVVIEHHYTDRDVGADVSDPMGLTAKDLQEDLNAEGLSHIVLRPATARGQQTSNILYASASLLLASQALVRAWDNGLKRGGSVSWEEIEDAVRLAKAALKVVRKNCRPEQHAHKKTSNVSLGR